MERTLHTACLALLCALGVALAAPAPPAAAEEAPKGFWLQGQLVVAVPPLPNEGYIQLAQRVMAEPERYPEIVAFNGDRPVMMGRNVRLPLIALKPELRGAVLRAMYPDDELTERGWAHNVADPLETLIQLTLAYTGSRGRFRQLARYNALSDADRLRLGTTITIPLEWIPDELGFKPLAVKAPLELLRDRATGRIFATYTLKKNETLYSLILRFTDRERAAEVRRMSDIMVRLNGLSSAKAAPTHRPLRMPVEWLSEEYLVSRAAPAPAPPPVPRAKAAFGDEPLHVIIDPGHGGVDPGAVYGSRRRGDHVYEHEVVYDIALRLAALLEAKGVHTHLTVEDRAQARPVARLSTRRLGKERVRVNPPYRMDSADVSINMRVYLVDALFRRLTGRGGVAPENVILISIHGDALAPTLRGAMVYYPDHRLRAREFRPRGRVYRLRQEALPAYIRFNPRDGRDSQWSSKSFAEEVIAALKGQGVGVGHRRPVRSYYYREGERTLPAVLRYSRIPTSVLVEVGNLNNPRDRRAILQAPVRQKIARGLAGAVLRQRRGAQPVALTGKAG